MAPELTQVLYTAIVLGSAYSLMSAGLTLIWGGLRFLNLAHGALFTLGGFLTYWFVKSTHTPAFLGLIVAFFGVATAGGLVYLVVYKPLLRRPGWEDSTLQAGVGIAIVLGAWFTLESPRDVRPRPIVHGTVRFPYDLVVTTAALVSIVVGLAVLLLLAYFLARTTLGMQVRAVASNRDGAEITGIHTGLVFLLVMAVSSGLAGLSGSILGSIYTVSPSSGFTALLFGLIVTVVGGLGSFGGTIMAAYLIGATQSAISFWFGGQWVFPVLFGALMLFLLVRPQGIAGKLTFDPSRQ